MFRYSYMFRENTEQSLPQSTPLTLSSSEGAEGRNRKPPSDEGGGKNRRFLTEGEKSCKISPALWENETGLSPPVNSVDSPLVRGGQGVGI